MKYVTILYFLGALLVIVATVLYVFHLVDSHIPKLVIFVSLLMGYVLVMLENKKLRKRIKELESTEKH